MKFDANQFIAYDPYDSFTGLGERFVKSTGESSFSGWRDPLTSDAIALWRLGRDAFQALEVGSKVEFDDGFSGFLDGMEMNRSMLRELCATGAISPQTAEGIPVSPDWESYRADELLAYIWQLREQIPNVQPVADPLLRTGFLYSCLKQIDDALIAYMIEGRGVVQATLGAAADYANAIALRSGSLELKKARQELAIKGAMERIRRDPKTADKETVKAYWLRWIKQPDLYESKAAFVRDMLDGKTTALTGNAETVNRWLRQWEDKQNVKYPYLVNTTKPAQ
ncbi:hypothetical protein F3J20_16120 [Paraburkholderia sp. Cy-641]|uniref:hypothetical protein n=1 Tax=Paraburkholderia sp. Cy-641 TaxID=2608337 RepID=UPI001422A45B|nr:hypothetical protein [Paraburkholderia sp. Cy-641]NIF78894.1 hypothetical protein [Paraburkholderia sp. Cy-641]